MRAQFSIPGEPYGKARHRFTKMGIAYTPKETVNYETLVRTIFKQNCPDWPLTTMPIRIEVNAFFPIPKSASRKKRIDMLDGYIVPTKRPDWDNIGKIITDSLNQIAWHDDAQVVSAHVLKAYAEIPRVDVWLEVLFDEDQQNLF